MRGGPVASPTSAKATRPEPMTDASIRVFSSFEEAESIWRPLDASPSTYLFQRFVWLKQWYDAVGYRRHKLCLLLVEDVQARWRVLAPLGITWKGPFRVLTWLGGKVTDYQGPLVAGEDRADLRERLPVIWAEAKMHLPPFDVAHFVHQPAVLADGSDNPWLALGGWSAGTSYQTMLEGSWPSFYETQVKPRIRADSKRQRRRLAEAGEVRFLLAEGLEEVAALTEVMIRQKRRRYEEIGAEDVLSDEAYRRFYHHVGAALQREGMVHVSALVCGEEVVATHWGAVVNGRFYFLMPTFEGGAWRRFSAGRILLEEVLRWAFEHRLRVFDFTVGDEPYKLEWSTAKIKIFSWIEPASIAGRLYFSGFRTRRFVRSQPLLRALVMRVRGVFGSKPT